MNATMALGLTLVHFLWQGVAVAGVLALLLAATAQRSASTRYGLSLAALGMMLALPIATGVRLLRDASSPSNVLASAVAIEQVPGDLANSVPFEGAIVAEATADYPVLMEAEPARAGGVARSLFGVQRLMEPLLPWLVLFWVAGVAALSVRLMGGWAHSQRLTRLRTQPTSRRIRAVFDRLADRLEVSHTVRIVESAIVQVPAVVGWLRPVVLLPISAAAGLTPQQLEALLAHELAHIRRNDYFVNLLQTVVETLLFYHPAVWWVSRRIREEREHCCDDMAVAVTGNVRAYAGALAELEYLRAPAAQLVATARGGSLLGRVQRLLGPSGSDPKLLPRWMAGAVAVTAALLIGGSAQLSGLGSTDAETERTPDLAASENPEERFEPEYTLAVEPALVLRAEPTLALRVEPTLALRAEPTLALHAEPLPPRDYPAYSDSVIVHSGDGALRERWNWARRVARGEELDSYWIGYAIRPNSNLEGWIRVKQTRTHMGGGTYMSGRFTVVGDRRRFRLPGVDLGTLVDDRPSDHTAVFFGFDTDWRGRERLSQVYISSFGLPVDLEGQPLVWLVDADDGESIRLAHGLYDDADAVGVKEMLVSAVGVHGNSSAVVPVLIEWLEDDEPVDVREEAADWLGYHPMPQALYALARAARGDRDRDVQGEAAEAIGELDLPAATDTLISLAQTLEHREVRSEAVESLGEKDDVRAVRTLSAIARNDPDSEVQQEAVETLGETGQEGVTEILFDIAQNHPRTDVQEEAIETMAEVASTPETAELLVQVAESHANVNVQREAVETLGELSGVNSTEALSRIARDHPRAAVREEAIETLVETADRDDVLELLVVIAKEDASTSVQSEAVETIGELGTAEAVAQLVELARTHPRSDVRQEAVETLGETGSEAAVPVLVELAAGSTDADVQEEAIETLLDVAPRETSIEVLAGIANGRGRIGAQREAVETLGEMRDRRALTVIAEIARTHAREDVRVEAIESYAEAAPRDSAVALLLESAFEDSSLDVQEEAVESLGEIETVAAIDAIIEIAGSHSNRRVRVEAIECLAESRHPRAEAAIRRLIRRP